MGHPRLHALMQEKDELYAQIERARGFTKIALIPFQSGRTAPGPAQIEDLVKRIEDPEVQKLLSDPTVALIFVGYADTQGDRPPTWKFLEPGQRQCKK